MPPRVPPTPEEPIESEIRNKQAEAGGDASSYVSELSALATERSEKIAEIDAL